MRKIKRGRKEAFGNTWTRKKRENVQTSFFDAGKKSRKDLVLAKLLFNNGDYLCALVVLSLIGDEEDDIVSSTSAVEVEEDDGIEEETKTLEGKCAEEISKKRLERKKREKSFANRHKQEHEQENFEQDSVDVTTTPSPTRTQQNANFCYDDIPAVLLRNGAYETSKAIGLARLASTSTSTDRTNNIINDEQIAAANAYNVALACLGANNDLESALELLSRSDVLRTYRFDQNYWLRVSSCMLQWHNETKSKKTSDENRRLLKLVSSCIRSAKFVKELRQRGWNIFLILRSRGRDTNKEEEENENDDDESVSYSSALLDEICDRFKVAALECKSGSTITAQSEADASTSASTSSNSSNSEKTGMNLATTPTPAASLSKDQFVNFFRMALPYITMHKSSVFVIHIPGNVMRDKKSNVFKSVMQDIIILRELGVKLVLVLGSDSQISDLTALKGEKPKFSVSKFGATRRITDEFSLEAAMEACGRNNIAVQAQLTRGPDVRLTRKHGDHYSDTGGFSGGGNNSGGRKENIRDIKNNGRNFPVATSGNYVYARRRGVVDGVDYGLTGEVVKIDKTSILETLEQGDVVLLSSLGFNAAGEVFNCVSRDIAVAAAIELNADKLIVLPEDGYLPRDETTNGKVKSYFTLSDAKKWMKNFAKGTEYEDLVENHRAYAWLRSGYASNGSSDVPGNGGASTNTKNPFTSSGENIQVNSWMRAQEMDYEWRVPSCPIEMCAATFACHCGVKRVHMVDPNKSGSLLMELFTSDGEGTMVAGDRYEGTRKATIYDCIGIHDMLQPLADAGIVVYRTEEELRRSLMNERISFFVTERDGNIIACASLTEYENGKSYEIGSFAVAREYRREGRGDALLSYLEEHASEKGCERLFLLTTRTAEWFTSRGFEFDGAAKTKVQPYRKVKRLSKDEARFCFRNT
ncbi:unnamed protein product [Bathycoccus prasinos]